MATHRVSVREPKTVSELLPRADDFGGKCRVDHHADALADAAAADQRVWVLSGHCRHGVDGFSVSQSAGPNDCNDPRASVSYPPCPSGQITVPRRVLGLSETDMAPVQVVRQCRNRDTQQWREDGATEMSEAGETPHETRRPPCLFAE